MDASTILTVLNELAIKLQGPASHVYNVFYKQVLINSAMDLTYGLFFMVLAYLSKRMIKSLCKDFCEDVFLTFLGSIVTLLFVTLGFMFWMVALAEWINPDYYTIVKLIEKLKLQ